MQSDLCYYADVLLITNYSLVRWLHGGDMAQDEVDTMTKVEMNQTEQPKDQLGTASGPNEPVLEQTNEGELPMAAKKDSKGPVLTVMLAIVIVIAGIGTGYALTQVIPSSGGSGSSSQEAVVPEEDGAIVVGKVYGVEDRDNFPDEVEGVMIAGGIDGEGSNHILRPGGDSQTVYLTSSVIDLDIFNDHLVMVWGETFDAQKAGWLMDVGGVRVVELNAEKPFEED